MPRRRNLAALSPLLRKGGVHEKSKTGKRVQAKLATQSAIDEWREEYQDKQEEQTNGEQKLPVKLTHFPPGQTPARAPSMNL